MKMILEQETFKEYGYYPGDLKPKSNKKILAACDDCGKVRVTTKKYHALCGSCMQKGERNNLFGRTGKDSTGWKGGLVKCICEYCGKEFEVYPSQVKKGYGKFCSHSCAAKNRKGENNSNWQGGISFEPYCEKFDEPFREYLRDKFGRVCFLCPKTEEENGRRLDVHHVNYNKNCGCDGDLTCQFVPLCRSCNSKVNHNRETWEAKIKNEMRNKLNGWYI